VWYLDRGAGGSPTVQNEVDPRVEGGEGQSGNSWVGGGEVGGVGGVHGRLWVAGWGGLGQWGDAFSRAVKQTFCPWKKACVRDRDTLVAIPYHSALDSALDSARRFECDCMCTGAYYTGVTCEGCGWLARSTPCSMSSGENSWPPRR
jgi:hypothetical protein